MERLSVLCFAGTYSLALAGDLARFFVRSRARWYLTLGLTALGWAVHTAYLANLARRDGQVPLGTLFDSLIVLSWILAAVTLYLMAHSPRTVAVGVFLLPIVVALAATAGLSGPRPVWTNWNFVVSLWGMVHGVFLMLGAVSTCVAFVAGLMYLVQSYRLKHKRPPAFGFALPSLEQSERLNQAAITLAFPLLTFGLLIGVALTMAAPQTGGVALTWTDPKILSALAMWLAFAVLLHARYRPAMRGRRVMWLTAVAFAFLVFTWVGVELLHLPTAHGVPQSAGRGS
jgi:ABC-type transport system involved in cytochrome c biogenesis permease subunit